MANRKSANVRHAVETAWQHLAQGRIEAALQQVSSALAGGTEDPSIWHLAGIAMARRGQLDNARSYLSRAIQLAPATAELHVALGAVLLDLGNLADAESTLREALRLSPGNAAAHNNLGNALLRQQRVDEAIACYDSALVANPTHPNALRTLSRLLLNRGRTKEAEGLTVRALSSDQLNVNLWKQLAECRGGEYRLPGMVIALKAALDPNPNDPELNTLLLVCLRQLHRFSEAKMLMDRLNSDLLQLPSLAGVVSAIHLALGETDKAIAHLRGVMACTQLRQSDQSNFLFMLNYSSSLSAAEIVAEHMSWGRRCLEELPVNLAKHGQHFDPERPLTIGFVSGDLRQHSVAFFLEPLLQGLRNAGPRIICYQTGGDSDAVTSRLKRLVHGWRTLPTVPATDQLAFAKLVASDRIDILVDLSGHTEHSRVYDFAKRLAPIQVSYLGYPGTTGLPAIDYRISDARADPESCGLFSAETIYRLPDCFHCYQGDDTLDSTRRRTIESTDAIVFGCFNVFPKINDQVINAWAEILTAVPKSRLMIKTASFEDQGACSAFTEQFRRRGIDSDRLILLARVEDQRAHFNCYREVDIALDTFPYNGTTTTCEALWMGVPVITFSGDRHAARVGASLLAAIGHNELVGKDARDYVRLAVQLAEQPDRIEAYRRRLRDDMKRSPLTDATGFAKQFLQALRTMWRQRAVQHSTAVESRTPLDGSLSIHISTGVQLVVPDAIDRLTPYVLLEQESWFEDELRFVAQFLRPSMSAIDIGANYGVYALTAAKAVGPQGKVIAFEPTSTTRHYLMSSAAANEFDWLDIRSEAIGSSAGELVICLHENPELNRLVSDESGVANFDRVAIAALDELFPPGCSDSPDFVKIDAEGYEADVVRGATKLLSRISPLLMFEIRHGDDLRLDVVSLLEELGYQVYRLIPALNCLVPAAVGAGTLDSYQLNLFACKQDRAAEMRKAGLLIESIPTLDHASESSDRLPSAAVEFHARARRLEAMPDERYKALLLAHEAALVGCSQMATQRRLSTLARTAADLGERAIAVATLGRALGCDEGPVSTEPFLSPSAHFDSHADGGNDVTSWLSYALVERFVQLHAFSGYFDRSDTQLPLLEAISQHPCRSPEMVRRLQLQRMRRGTQERRCCDPILAETRHDNLNPSLWCAANTESEGRSP